MNSLKMVTFLRDKRTWMVMSLLLTLVLTTISCIPSLPNLPGLEPPTDLVAPKNELTLRIEKVLEDNTDGEVGLYLKQLNEVDGIVLASLNADTVFEPVSAIKVLHHVHALLEVQDDDVNLFNQIAWNEESTNKDEPHNGCPFTEMPDPISLEDALNQMMTISDNRTTQAVRILFGEDNINATAQMLGMTNTMIQHRIGCSGDIKDEEDEIIDFGAATYHNQTTLFDIGILYEQVAKAEVLTSTQYKDKFYSLMSNQSNSTFFKDITDEEAKILCLDPNRTGFFKNQRKFA